MKKIIGFIVLAIVFFGMTFSSVRMPVANAASQVDINIAIEKGLAYLATTQDPSGHWGWYTIATTSMAVLSYENAPNNHFGWNLSDPYHTTVQKGLDWLFAVASVQPIGMQPAGDPDSNGNGIGICYPNNGLPIYETPMVLMAIVASQAPNMVTTTGPANVINRTYYDIAVDIADYLAWAQNEAGAGRGGWRYWPNYGDSDNSLSQWPVLGLMAAELWGINAAAFVKSELLNYWTVASQNLDGNYSTNYFYGSFGYTDKYYINDVAETSAGILELTYCGVPKTDPRIAAAQGYIVRDWLTTSGWRCNLGNFYAMYAVMKACRLATPTPIKYIANYTGAPTMEWYNGTGEYADLLISHQGADGRWDQWVAPTGITTNLSTAWGILILEYVPFVVKYKLTVHVVDSATNSPISGANLQAEGPDTYLGTTDTNGEFIFFPIQAGMYNVTATAAGYYTGSQMVNMNANKTITIELHSSARVFESCDAVGTTQNTFNTAETVYGIGGGFQPSTTFVIYLVDDVTWVDGMAIPSRIPGTADTVNSDSSGNIPVTALWNASLSVGKYDIVIDVNRNGVYNAGIDVLDDNDVVTAGFLVIPEIWLGTVMSIVGFFGAFGVFRFAKRKFY